MAAERDELDWPEYISEARTALSRTRTKDRTETLAELRVWATKPSLEPAQVQDLVRLLVSTVPRYVDSTSRQAVLAVLSALLARDYAPSRDDVAATSNGKTASLTNGLIRWLEGETAKVDKTGASSTRFALLAWANTIYSSVPADHPLEDAPFASLAITLSTLLNAVLDEANGAKESIRKSALVSTRRAVRTRHESIPRLVTTLASAKSDPSYRHAALVGLAMDVALRLKDPKGHLNVGKGYVEELKPIVNDLYLNSVVTSKTVPPSHVLGALSDFFAATVTIDDATSTFIPAMEKALNRAAEPALTILRSFFAALPPSVSSDPTLRQKLAPAILTSAKSSSAPTRAASIRLFSTLYSSGSEEDLLPVAEQVYTPVRTGKTTFVDHRVALYTMLASLPPSPKLSAEIVTTALTALPKETNENTVSAVSQVLSAHLPAVLLADTAVPAPQIAALVKGMADTKPAIRRLVQATVGNVFWVLKESGKEATQAEKAFATGLLPGFEASLKIVTTNMLNSPSGPLEGYVAVAVLKSRASKWGVKKIDDLVNSNAAMQRLGQTGAKPNFFLYDKVYRKASSVEDGVWLARALEAFFDADEDKLAKDETLRANFAAALLHLITEGASHDIRAEAVGFVRKACARSPKLVHLALRDGMRAWLVQSEKAKAVAKPTAEDAEAPLDRAPRLRAVLSALASFDDEVDQQTREDLLVQLVVLAHYPRLSKSEASLWVDLLLIAKVSPDKVIAERLSELIDLVLADASLTPANQAFADAAYRAVTTCALVLPEKAVPALFAQFQDDLLPSHLEFIGATEFGVWGTPEGQTFVDVLADAKKKTSATPVGKANSKEHQIALWEAELRESLSRKKPVAAQLSKQDRATLDKQLALESEIRAQVGTALGRLRRGFRFALCLISSHAELVREYLAKMIEQTLAVIMLQPATLVAEEAFETYLALANVCSERLGVFKTAIGVAVLRSVEAQVVPENYRAEPLPDLISRVLFQLRFLSEQSPFDAGTYAYAAPLLSKILRTGGVGIDKSQAETALEQLSLALDVISFHVRQCSDTAFPRLALVGDLLAALTGYPSLSRTAATALADLGEAMQDNASSDEIAAILDGALAEEAFVRLAALQALQPLDLTDLDFPVKLWVLAHDVDERNRELAITVWQENGLSVPAKTFLPPLIALLSHSAPSVREAVAAAIAEGVTVHSDHVADALLQLIAEYEDKAKELVPEYDRFGMLVEESLSREDPWRTRKAIATTLRLMADLFSPADVETFFDLLIAGKALGDRSQSVRTEMLEAAQTVIDIHGKETLQHLIETFEEYLARPSTGDETQDLVTEALVILFGRLARHLDPTDPRIKTVIGRLIEALKTPSEVVQAAVCDCLPPLVKVRKDDIPDLVDQLLNDLFNAPKYAERRGAAYGLAGVIQGRGLSAVHEFGIMGRLQDNAEDKKSLQARQGAVFGYEVFATVLGRLFEPYIPEILPTLLASFGDPAPDVREATSDAAKAIMSRLSGHAVKLILPTLLEGLDEKQWRAKKGAIELMGAMAFLAPRQLSASLPTILPRLTEVLTDTHKQVRESANTSLKRFGEVVTNPEIKEMTSILLDALVDPARKTPKALDTLLTTTFAHFIDASSLALLVPILDRGLRERSADVKRKSAAIVGNMATLTEPRDLIPYLNQLVPLLRDVLVDPVPEARSTAAKSLGGLVERLGENNFPDLIDSLMSILKSPSAQVDQQGAAQGVAEILAGLGTDRLEEMLPVILQNTSSPRTYVREGHISLLVFLPVTFGDRFSPYLGKIIQPVLSGLADDSDFVRDASMRAGRMIVANHSTKAIDLLLPELEQGLFDESWRIRQSSVQLVGDLLFRISGISGKISEEDEGDDEAEETAAPGLDAAKKALIEGLGKERRDRVLAAIYIVRQDAVGVVRQAAIGVWKALVSNTPRTVREILPILMQTIVRILASPALEQRETAARCLADSCRRLGESVLGEVISILQKAMLSQDRRQREGVCLAFTELMANTSKSSLEAHEETVIAAVRSALVDSDASVRSAASQAFDIAQQVIGPRSIDEIIPTLLDALQTPGATADAALEALREVMQVRAEKIFPVLIPRLIAQPITAFNARALSALVRVAGSALGRRVTHIVDALQTALEKEQDEETKESLDAALTAVLAAVEDHDSGLGSLQMHMLGLCKHESPTKRITGCNLFARFCRATEADFSDYVVDYIRQLVSLFDDRTGNVVTAAWSALDALVKKLDKEDMEPLVVPLRRTIEGVGLPGHPVEGFSRPNGLKPILPILLQGLLAGTAEQREQAAYGLGDLVERTTPEAFKAYCIQTVGPLIRVIGDRLPPPVKSAILSTLTILLKRTPLFVKPFFPQLQRTFVKSLVDTSSLSVRNRAVAALGALMQHQPRVDPLVTELVNLVASEEGDVRDSVVNGLAATVASGGKNMSESSISSVVDIISEAFAESPKESYATAVARLVASVALHSPSSLDFIVASFVLGTSTDLPPTQLSAIALRELIDTAPAVLYELDKDATVDRVVRMASGSATGGTANPAIARPARETKELMKEREPWRDDEDVLSRL
ncbi:eIF-2-alpha kinase activator gcn1 [Rhodotorula toruloides]|nr:eIF-2-alpha kinase activator gcn1 [Rhodotorula toruloides]